MKTIKLDLNAFSEKQLSRIQISNVIGSGTVPPPPGGKGGVGGGDAPPRIVTPIDPNPLINP
jgi:hypothetical protein